MCLENLPNPLWLTWSLGEAEKLKKDALKATRKLSCNAKYEFREGGNAKTQNDAGEWGQSGGEHLLGDDGRASFTMKSLEKQDFYILGRMFTAPPGCVPSPALC